MDREQEEMQFLGLFDIYTESFKIILTWRKIFSQITLALILPLSFIFLIHMELSHLILSKIDRTESELAHDQSDTTRFNNLSNLVTKEWIVFLLFKLLYFTFLLIFSLLSTAAVVYTIASIYTSKDVSFRKVISVVHRVWKRLMVTFVCMFLATMVYNIITFVLLCICVVLFSPPGLDVVGKIVVTVLLVIYAAGFVYLTIVWQLASVVSVLEESYGFRAVQKSRALIRGKIWVTAVIFFKLIFALLLIEVAFESLVVHGGLAMMGRVGYGVLCFLLLFKLILFGLVVQTVIYFVCKSYHHENIDKSALSDHLEVYLGDYVPLKSKDVQLEEYSV